MKETKYTVKYTTSFKKDYKRAIKRGLKIFFVQMAYTIIASRKGLIVWLEIPQTSVSAWTQI